MDSIEKIKEALIIACIKSRPSYFKPYLSSINVTTEWANKEIFYKFFKYILSTSRKISEGKLHLIIKVTEKDNIKHYEF